MSEYRIKIVIEAKDTNYPDFTLPTWCPMREWVCAPGERDDVQNMVARMLTVCGIALPPEWSAGADVPRVRRVVGR